MFRRCARRQSRTLGGPHEHARLISGSLIVLVIVTALLATGCQQGPAERAGKQVDRAIDDFKDAAKRATR